MSRAKSKNSAVQQFVTQASMTFKTFDYQVVISKNKSNLWHYVATPPGGAKKYMVYCAPNLAKVKKFHQGRIEKGPTRLSTRRGLPSIHCRRISTKRRTWLHSCHSRRT